MKNLSVSAVVLTKNEEANIKGCLKSLSFCDEIVVVDDNSSDKTVGIAEKLGAKVFRRDMNMDYSAQSNFGMEKAKGEWILFVDADERVSKFLREEIEEVLKEKRDIVGFYVKRKDYLWGKWLEHGEIASFISLRLVKKASGRWVRRVHPHFDTRGEILYLRNPLLHYPHQTLAKFIRSVDQWSTWHCLANKEEGKRSSILKIVFLPPAHFLLNFVFRLGFLDDIHGFVFAVIMSFHSFLAWSKLLLVQKSSSKL